MHTNIGTNSTVPARERENRLRLHESEQLISVYPTMLRWQALMWIVLLFGSSGSLLGLAIVLAYLMPGGEGLGLYDRVLRLVLQVNSALFGEHAAHLTSQRLVIEIPGREPESYALGNFTGTDTRTFDLRGNLFLPMGGAIKRRLGLWVVRRNEVAERIRRACRQRR